jgi:ComF family protein
MNRFMNQLTRQAARFAALTREYLFSVGCAGCGRDLLDAHEAWYGLCRTCLEGFSLSGGERCSSCGRPLISEQGQCLPCRESAAGSVFDGAFSLFPHTGGGRNLLGAYKFGKNLALGNVFAERILQALDRLPLSEPKRVLVPVPPRPGKIRRTGWDQMAYLAQLLKKEGSVTLCPCLKRLPSQSQKELNREDRQTNLRGKIRCVKPIPRDYARELILFDDVITTGATLDACARALKNAGARRVFALSLFYR